jgi:Leucine-rich repeat (LRR) protein
LIELGVDTDGDRIISAAEAKQITSLDVSYRNISDLTGIEAFVYLNRLICENSLLTTLDVSNNTSLLKLLCCCNQLTTLNILNNTALEEFDCSCRIQLEGS